MSSLFAFRLNAHVQIRNADIPGYHTIVRNSPNLHPNRGSSRHVRILAAKHKTHVTCRMPLTAFLFHASVALRSPFIFCIPRRHRNIGPFFPGGRVSGQFIFIMGNYTFGTVWFNSLFNHLLFPFSVCPFLLCRVSAWRNDTKECLLDI